MLIGSFINVVLFRYNTGRGLGGRSKCFSCTRELAPVDLIPVLSFVMFKGRCRTCKSKISWQYPAVELLTGILFAAAVYVALPILAFSTVQFAVHVAYVFVILAVLVLIVVYDIKHKIIPDAFVFLFAALSFVNLFLGFDSNSMIHLVWPPVSYLIAGLALAFPFYLVWLFSAGAWMGLGDAKLALGIGWLLGLGQGATAIIYGFWIGAVVSILIMLSGFAARKFGGSKVMGRTFPRLSMKTEIPFAPFLVAGLRVVLFFGYNMCSIFYV